MFRAFSLIGLALAGVTCGLAAQTPPPAQPLRPSRQLTLVVQDVTFSRPLSVVTDGTKKQVRAVSEFVVTSPEPLPVRALDPVIVVGNTRVTEYRYENGDRRLVFTLYEPEKVSKSVPVEAYLQYGDDESTRTPLPTVPRGAVRKVRR
jgi:hypothetical protein